MPGYSFTRITLFTNNACSLSVAIKAALLSSCLSNYSVDL